MTAVVGGAQRRRSVDRRTLYGRALLFALFVAFAATVATSSGADAASGRLGGDFPAFYAAGSIVADGDWDRLYDPDRQAEAQADLFPAADDDGSYLYFAYPPHVAALYRPLAAMDYRVAYTFHTALMLAALVAALALMRPLAPIVNRHFEATVTAALLTFPILRSVTGGQNTALTLLLIVGIWRGIEDDREIAAGLLLALSTYKPQYAVPLIGLFAVRGHWRALLSASAGVAALWAVGAVTSGTAWLPAWWTEVSEFAALDADINASNAISALGLAEAALGAGTPAARLVALPIMAAITAALVFIWRRGSTLDAGLRWPVTVVGVVALAPHAMFYDAGLLLIAAVVFLDRGQASVRWVGVAWLLAWLQPLGSTIGVAPTAAGVAVMSWLAWRAGSATTRPHPRIDVTEHRSPRSGQAACRAPAT